MSQQEFEALVRNIIDDIADKTVDDALTNFLNETFPPEGNTFRQLADACRTGIAKGWLCNREQAGIKFGRIIKPSEDTHGYSVDVVDMDNIAGPHHRHPKGEIDMVMPVTEGAKFDGYDEGWVVYGPESEHRPTVTGGRAIILYLLPDGLIEFTGQ